VQARLMTRAEREHDTVEPIRDLLRRLPKAELHCHLDGSLRPATMLEIARETGRVMPAADADALRRFMKVTDARNLEEYLARFETTLAVMQTTSALERVAYELVEDATADGVRYIEVRFAPNLNTREGLSLQEVIEASLRGLVRAERDHGTVARVIVCALRHQPVRVAEELAELAIAYRDRGVVGFDLAGGEAGNPATRYASAFAYAHRHDMACTCHAGEGAGAESVRDALHGCCADRIGHATRLIEDPSLLDYVIDRRITLEICLTSNVQTRAAESYARHPFRAYFDRGCNVVLNTDNRLMSGTTLTDEYVHAAEQLGFSFDELAQVALNSFESAFLSHEERTALTEQARIDIGELRS
jgi:adenosine deaminase